jgi:hydroxymethylpyrimidine/phosphomethylpyrimidine kinase
LARGESVPTAVAHALSYTWRALAHAVDTGSAQFLPSRPSE